MEPLPADADSSRRARRVLAAAAAVMALLFAIEARGSFAAMVSPGTVPADTTGPFGKGSDCMGYYAWLRSPLVDEDFHFDNEFAPTFARVPGSEAALPRTATGHRANPWPVGPAAAWAPAVVTVQGVLRLLGDASPWPADGYSAPYQLAVGGTTFALALLTLLLGYRIARRFAGPVAAAVGASLVTLGTPVVCYGAVETGASHGPAAAFLAVFVFAWLRSFGSVRTGRWLGLGALLGLTCLMRWQLSTFAVLPTLEAAWFVTRAGSWRTRFHPAALLVGCGMMTLLAFSPHFAAKQVVYGHPLGGLHKTAQNWLSPSVWTVLGSTDRSLFYWTPLALPALGGVLDLAWRTRRPAAVIFAAGLLVQLYTVASLIGGEAYLGWSFGFRFLTETCVLLAPGLAVLAERLRPRHALVAGVFVAWNLLLLGVYRHCAGGTGGGDPAAVAGFVATYVKLRPLDAGLMVIAAAGFTRTVQLALRSADTAAPLCLPVRPPAKAAA